MVVTVCMRKTCDLIVMMRASCEGGQGAHVKAHCEGAQPSSISRLRGDIYVDLPRAHAGHLARVREECGTVQTVFCDRCFVIGVLK